MKIPSILNVMLALALVILCVIMVKGNHTDTPNTVQADSVRSEVLAPIDVKKDFKENGFNFFPGMILCTGDSTENNAMTIGSGSIGNFLGVNIPAVMVYVKKGRYTHELLEKHKRFTIMKMKDPKIAEYLGWHSGRDGDKAKALGLHVAYTEHGTPYYEEADMVIECELMTTFQIDRNKFLNETPEKWYNEYDVAPASMGGKKIYHWEGGVHTVFVGQVLSALKKNEQ